MAKLDKTFKLNDDGDTLRIVCLEDGPGWYVLNGKRLPRSVGTVLDYAALKACCPGGAYSYVNDMLESLVSVSRGVEWKSSKRVAHFIRRNFVWVD